ncbi:platelet endothelial cell adhesion molecule isoform X5 [Lampris incognitus]|uniref:platelet endothelial cell adhesion molecule isoform X5 n=1 Tax=Lampris incognitus TaxID=2546036 RepID=UPI0024B4A819|nr:platelet endothelial cell adhesion molecule isoform X5 [Lampris incognitus]
MGLLLLLTFTLLSSWRPVGAQSPFTIRNVNLVIEPGNDVMRDTNVTLRCQAVVSTSDKQLLSRAYRLYKDNILVYTDTTNSSEDLVYQLPLARVSNTGKYECQIVIEGKSMSSEPKKLTVTGLSTPELHLSKRVLNEGEEVIAKCTAPGEMGPIIFYFYADFSEIKEERVNKNHVEVALRFNGAGIRKINCSYVALIMPNSVRSEQSNIVSISVKELPLNPVLEISPHQRVYEGDPLNITCTIGDFHSYSEKVHVYLSQGKHLLSFGTNKVNYSKLAVANEPGEFECRLEMGKVAKVATATVSVTELFSVPTLTVSPKDVFQEDEIKLICRSEVYAPERLRREELVYTIDPLRSHLVSGRGAGIFSGKTLPYEFNYTCSAKAKEIVKHSKTLRVSPKVPVSQPKISVVGRAVLGRPFQILCQSDKGSLPINYTLWRRNDLLKMAIVKQLPQKALFNVTIQRPDEISQYMCDAQNKQDRVVELSKRLNASVTVPVSDTLLTVLPDLRNIAEGDRLYLICSINGTPPVTFKWYRSGRAQPLSTTTSNKITLDYQVPEVSREHSGTYYCEAGNYANNVRSQLVTIDVSMAMWKKGLIVASCLLVVAVLVLLLVLHFRAKRGKREPAAELSVKPSSPKSDDSLTVSLTHDTEVYNAATENMHCRDLRNKAVLVVLAAKVNNFRYRGSVFMYAASILFRCPRQRMF